MFDKLIESNSTGAEFKPRRKFFMVSSVAVGIIFLSAVVASLYAQDISLGNDNFDLVEMIAPVAEAAPKPEQPRDQPRQQMDSQASTELPNRPELIARLDQGVKPPDTISTVPNTVREIPDTGRFTNLADRPDSDGNGRVGPSREGTEGSSSSISTDTATAEVTRNVDPPPAAPTKTRRTTPVSKGVVNGSAIDLPKPAYPAIAKNMNLSGSVNVQVLIDESGNVVSAKAVEGHPLFKLEAERAAKNARFRPTLLSDVPVKVTGIIVYRFTR